MNIIETLKSNRPNLSNSSLKTYNSILTNIHNDIWQNKAIKLKHFDNVEVINEFLKHAELNYKKTALSALYVLTKNEKYNAEMLKNIAEYDKQIDKQEKTQTQKDNWITIDEVKTKLEELKKTAKGDNLQDVQNYVILCLLGSIYINPRRLKDYTEFKIRNVNTETDNYLKGSYMFFNTYKGSDYKGMQKIKLPSPLLRILKRWIELNKGDYLLVDRSGNKLSNVVLNQRLNKIFGKKISVNALRHMFLTEKHGGTIKKLDELKDDMEKMASSILQSKTYIKK